MVGNNTGSLTFRLFVSHYILLTSGKGMFFYPLEADLSVLL